MNTQIAKLAVVVSAALTAVSQAQAGDRVQVRDGMSVQSVVASKIAHKAQPMLRWEQESQVSIAKSEDRGGVKWALEGAGIESVYSASAQEMVAAVESRAEWGIRSDAQQNGFKWGIRSDAEQNGFKWGIRSDAGQNGFKWGIRSDAEQNGFKWGIRSDAEHNGVKWGIRSDAE
ncbi:MAG: hypothetical protein AAF756_19425, partial [Pseudomonadota bacterium]